MKGVQSDGHDVTLVSMKIPIPFSFPYCKCVKIVWQMLGIDSEFYSQAFNGVDCK
jgi:hypothetical protein